MYYMRQCQPRWKILPRFAKRSAFLLMRWLRDHSLSTPSAILLTSGLPAYLLGSALARVTHTAIVNSAKQMFEDGEFSSLSDTLGGGQIEAMFDKID